MTETLRHNKAQIAAGDIGFGDSTSTFTQANVRQTNGTLANQSGQYVDDAVIPLSSASKTALGLSGTYYIDDAVTSLAAGTGIANATTSAGGKVKISDAQADPIAVTTNNAAYARILSAAHTAAITGSAQTPDYGNPVVTRYEMQLALILGSGKDGHGKLGAVAASSTAPTITSTATAGLLTNATGYDYKIAAYNLAGQIVASSASSSTGAVTAKQVTLTLPALPTNAMGWNVYRRTAGAGNYEYVGRAVLGFNYTETASDALRYIYKDNNPTPNASVTAPGSDTTGTSATLSGKFEFLTFTTTASDTITVASTGVYAGYLDIRVQGTWTGASLGWTITGTGANAVNVGFQKMFSTSAGTLASFLTPIVLGSGGIYTWSTAHVNTVTYSYAQGFGADCSPISRNWSGFGNTGEGTTGGVGGYGGALVRIWCRNTSTGTIGGTITVNGAAGTAGTTNGGGGGGGAGGGQDLGCLDGWADVGTRNAVGGNGGNGAGTGRGGSEGGGGCVVRRNCHSKSGATTSVAIGTRGTNGGTTANGGSSGAHYGNGGVNNSTATTAATAGQQFDLNGFYDPMDIFAT